MPPTGFVDLLLCGRENEKVAGGWYFFQKKISYPTSMVFGFAERMKFRYFCLAETATNSPSHLS